ncbi:MAG: L-threonylcarbamoyladenylate synthase [Candidatus Poribacteria bacterium]
MKTIILKVDAIKPNPEDIKKAVEVLKKGGIVAFPTDTVYGIGADIFNKDAVERIFSAKGRNSRKPLQVLIADKTDLNLITESYFDILHRLVDKFMPGALTIVMPAKSDFPKWVTCGLDTVGVRMTANTLAIEMIKAFGRPITATSANISGMPDPKDAQQVLEYLDGKIDLILDGGPTTDNIPSTVIDISVNPPRILRHGVISEEELRKEIEKWL